ncbi:hypothetical protein ACHAXR_000869, partial [Thalassiosira sp. AJA248-18]
MAAPLKHGIVAVQSDTKLETEECKISYLRRIGFSEGEANDLIADPPSLEQLQTLLTAHLHTVPFENMDQHEHPSHGDTPFIQKRTKEHLPSLDVTKTLQKIVYRKRGGFCFELNFSFRWLLASLGYSTRLALADVACNQPVPGHVVILVDNLMNANENGIDIENSDVPILVDVGFGTPGVCNVILPIHYNSPREDTYGDTFEFHSSNQHINVDNASDDDVLAQRFDTMLCRTRVGCPDVEKMYRFRLDDDMEMIASEFYEGLDCVLTVSPTFTGKRICVVSDSNGHVTLGKDYIKWVERGEVVSRIELTTETAWRNALA